MQVHEIQRNQIELWLRLVSDLAKKTAAKPENEITKRDIIKIAQKVDDIMKVLNGVSKIAGWRN
jgi:hypothetical protein